MRVHKTSYATYTNEELIKLAEGDTYELVIELSERLREALDAADA